METKMNNNTLLMGRNNSRSVMVEVVAGVARTLPRGTLITQKPGNGALFVPHFDSLTTNIDGFLLNDLAIETANTTTVHRAVRVFSGHVNEQLLVAANKDLYDNLDTIPTGGELSIRMHLENKGIVPILDANQSM